MISLTIDGQKVEVEEGTTVLQAAESIGIKIPSLCHHKALAPYGACRLCLVEITSRNRTIIKASCTYPAQEGIVVKTDTEKIIETRRMLIELLLARCDESEEIKEFAREYGVDKSRFRPKKKGLYSLWIMCKDMSGEDWTCSREFCRSWLCTGNKTAF